MNHCVVTFVLQTFCTFVLESRNVSCAWFSSHSIYCWYLQCLATVMLFIASFSDLVIVVSNRCGRLNEQHTAVYY